MPSKFMTIQAQAQENALKKNDNNKNAFLYYDFIFYQSKKEYYIKGETQLKKYEKSVAVLNYII